MDSKKSRLPFDANVMLDLSDKKISVFCLFVCLF